MEKTATNHRDRLLVRMLFRLGCRVSELLGITLDNIDLVDGTVTIQHLKARISLSCPQCGYKLGTSHAYCPGCGATVQKVVAAEKEHRRMRKIPIDEGTLLMLSDYIRDGGPVSRQGRRFVFAVNRHRAWRIVRDCGDRAGLSKLVNPETGRVHNVSPHRLRDAFAVHAVKHDDSGDGLRLLQEHLGHASFNTTAKYRRRWPGRNIGGGMTGCGWGRTETKVIDIRSAGTPCRDCPMRTQRCPVLMLVPIPEHAYGEDGESIEPVRLLRGLPVVPVSSLNPGGSSV